MNKVLLRKILSRNIDIAVLHYCQKPLTGYGLIGEVEKNFGVRLGAGVVYGCLMCLERDDLLDHTMIDGKNGRRAMSYIITAKGRICLVESVHDLQFLLHKLV